MTLRKTTLALLIAATLTPFAATNLHAQAAPAAQAPERVFTQAELDQMLAPVALYPDALLSQVLMASTYPIEVVEAARWTRANPGLTGDAAVRAAESQDWDPSVKSLVAFPQVLQRMDENLKWTESLGDAFLAQEPSVMDTVQQLRRRAQAAGNLRSTEQIRVQQQGQVIVVQSPPEVVYVPYYDPLVVYGPWWHPAYRPVVWAPWPGYARPRPGVSVNLWFGSPVGVNVGFFFGDFDWGRRHVRVVRPDVHYYRPPTVVVNRTTVINRNVTVERNGWQHDPHHRRGVAYRAPEVRQRFADAKVERRDEQREARRDERGNDRRDDRRAADKSTPAPQVVNRPQVEEKKQAEAKAQPEVKRDDRRQTQEQARKERMAQREERKQAPVAERPKAETPARPQAQQPQERPKAEVQARPQTEARERAQTQVRERQQARQEQPKAEPRPQPQPQAQPQARPEPRPQPQAQPQPQARPEPRPQAEVRERPQPQVREQRQEARQEQRQERQEQRPPQRQEPRSERGGGERGGKGGDKS